MVGEVGGGYLSWDGGTANATMHSVSRMSLDRRYLSAILGYPIARSLDHSSCSVKKKVKQKSAHSQCIVT